MDADHRREIILENYQNPYHKEEINDNTYKMVNTSNQSCIDNLDIKLKIENRIIINLYFTGEACAISTSATSIMNKLLEGKTILEALDIIENYENMINEKEYNDTILGEANAFSEVYKQANRIGCALLPWNGIKKLLLEEIKQE